MGMKLAAGLPCRVETNRLGRLRKFKATATSVNSVGAELLALEPATVGQTLKLVLEDFSDQSFDTKVAGCQSDGLDSYRITIKLANGAWPYQLYSRIAEVAHVQESSLSTPKCLKELGLTAGCTIDDIEDAFARLVRRCHPDRGGTVDEFVRIRRAYLDSLAYFGGRR